MGPEGGVVREALWLFDGNGDDLSGGHNATLVGSATFSATPNNQGLHTNDAGSYATYSPTIDQMDEGQIIVDFMLDDTFTTDAGSSNPIVIISSNRGGHNAGDFSVRLDPTDGKMWFVQENPVVSPDWVLKTTKSTWEPNVWFTAMLTWSSHGRRIHVTWDSGAEEVSDTFGFPCFAADASETFIASRASDTPTTGLTIDRIEVRH